MTFEDKMKVIREIAVKLHPHNEDLYDEHYTDRQMLISLKLTIQQMLDKGER